MDDGRNYWPHSTEKNLAFFCKIVHTARADKLRARGGGTMAYKGIDQQRAGRRFLLSILITAVLVTVVLGQPPSRVEAVCCLCTSGQLCREGNDCNAAGCGPDQGAGLVCNADDTACV